MEEGKRYTLEPAPAQPMPEAVRSAPSPVKKKGGGCASTLGLFFAVLLLTLVGVWGLRTYVITPYVIPSSSMEDTILIGDHVMTEMISIKDGVSYGEIVTFNDPDDTNITLIKRVIATEGQTVDLIDGDVVIDGHTLIEDYTNKSKSEPLAPRGGYETISYPYTVPAGHVWVMGDNRENSADSRTFGAIPTSSITGHALMIFYPFDRIQQLN